MAAMLNPAQRIDTGQVILIVMPVIHAVIRYLQDAQLVD
jgi:hypothetical protein